MSYAIEFLKTLGAVPAYGYHESGSARVLGLKPRLKRHAEPRGADLERDRIAQDSLYARDVRWPILPARDGVSVGVDANRCITIELTSTQCFIEEQTCGGADGRSFPRRNHDHIQPKPAKSFRRSIRCRGEHPKERLL